MFPKRKESTIVRKKGDKGIFTKPREGEDNIKPYKGPRDREEKRDFEDSPKGGDADSPPLKKYGGGTPKKRGAKPSFVPPPRLFRRKNPPNKGGKNPGPAPGGSLYPILGKMPEWGDSPGAEVVPGLWGMGKVPLGGTSGWEVPARRPGRSSEATGKAKEYPVERFKRGRQDPPDLGGHAESAAPRGSPARCSRSRARSCWRALRVELRGVRLQSDAFDGGSCGLEVSD